MTHELQSEPALLTGSAQRISAAEKAALAVKAAPAVLRATIHITRAATGKVEAYELVCHHEEAAPEPSAQE